MTEIGRKLAIISGSMVLVLCILIGIFSNSDMVMTTVYAFIAGLLFGVGGLLVGNLFDGYVFRAARRELARAALEKELEDEIRKASKKAIVVDEEEELETEFD